MNVRVQYASSGFAGGTTESVMTSVDYSQFDKMSPFEIKDGLIKFAKARSPNPQMPCSNAGRGNPNWIATAPREAYFPVRQFALTEARRAMDDPQAGVAGMPQQAAPPAARSPGCQNIRMHREPTSSGRCVDFSVKTFGFDADAFVYEMTDSIIGDNYPVPDRMLVHAEKVVHRYLMWAMCGDKPPPGEFKLYAVEGGTAAMLLHLQIAHGEPHSEERRYHRLGHADLYTLHGVASLLRRSASIGHEDRVRRGFHEEAFDMISSSTPSFVIGIDPCTRPNVMSGQA